MLDYVIDLLPRSMWRTNKIGLVLMQRFLKLWLIDLSTSQIRLSFMLALILFLGADAKTQESSAYFVLLFKENSLDQAKNVAERTVDKSRIIKWYDQNIWLVGIGPKSHTDALALQNDIATKTKQKGNTQLIRFRLSYVETTVGVLNASNQIIESPTTVSTDTLSPNLSITTDLPKFPARPSSSSYEMMSIEAKTPRADRIFIQIFSDGQASVVAGGTASFFMHKGDGSFVSRNSKLSIDEKNNRIDLDGMLISNVVIAKKNRPKPVEQMTYGERLNFPSGLADARDEVELQAACASAATVFANKPNWYDKKEQLDAQDWSSCIDLSNKGDEKYLTYRSNWEKRLSTKQESEYTTFYYSRCTKDYAVTFSNDPRYGKQCFRVIPRH